MTALLPSYIRTCSSALEPFDLSIRETYIYPSAPSPPVKHYVLTNTAEDGYIQLATLHSPEEIGFFRRLLDDLFVRKNDKSRINGEVLCINSVDAVNLRRPREEEEGTSDKGLTLAEAESALEAFVQEGWLAKTPGGRFTMGVRGLVELNDMLQDAYNAPDEDDEEPMRVKFCKGCQKVLMSGVRCPNVRCSCRMHEYCAEKVLGRERKCPVCKKEWDGEAWVGEKAIEAGRSSRARGGRRSQRNRDDDEDEEMDETPTQARRRSGRVNEEDEGDECFV